MEGMALVHFTLFGSHPSRHRARSAFDMLSYDQVELQSLMVHFPHLKDLIPNSLMDHVGAEALYGKYLIRQATDIEVFRKDEGIQIPRDFDFNSVDSLSNEEKEKLSAARPQTLAAAKRISGVTPSSLYLLLRLLKKKQKDQMA